MRRMLQVGGKKEKSNRREITEKGSKVGRRNIKSSGRLVFCDKSRCQILSLGPSSLVEVLEVANLPQEWLSNSVAGEHGQYEENVEKGGKGILY
jgi:hypothetical protein